MTYTFLLTFPDGRQVIDQVEKVADIVKKYDLATRERTHTRVQEIKLGDYLPE